MRVLLLVIILIFSIQSLSNADDVRDFELEGVSIGDSLLDHFSEKEIKKEMNNAFFYKDNKFVDIFFDINRTYDYLQVTVKPNDKSYIIQGISESGMPNRQIWSSWEKYIVVRYL